MREIDFGNDDYSVVSLKIGEESLAVDLWVAYEKYGAHGVRYKDHPAEDFGETLPEFVAALGFRTPVSALMAARVVNAIMGEVEKLKKKGAWIEAPEDSPSTPGNLPE